MFLAKSHAVRKYRRDLSLTRFRDHLAGREMAPATVEKYLRDVSRFLEGAGKGGVFGLLTKQAVIAYKASLVERYAPASVNSMIASVNCYLDFVGKPGLKARHIRVQRRTCRAEAQELSRAEYGRLIEAARATGRERTGLAIQTLCATGMRIGELKSVTVEAVREGRLVISSKGKIRCAWLPGKLQEALRAWAEGQGLSSGPVFRTRTGRPLDRVRLWREMKLVAGAAQVAAGKAYPHNLRHLFACTHYGKHRDIAALSDLLGHSHIETTRIYVAATGRDQQEQVSDLGLVAWTGRPETAT